MRGYLGSGVSDGYLVAGDITTLSTLSTIYNIIASVSLVFLSS